MADKTQIWLSVELQKVKAEILNEMKKNSSGADLFAKELRYGYKQNQSIYDGLSAMIKSLDEKLSDVQEKLAELSELKYNYNQLQSAYEELNGMVSGEVIPKLDDVHTADIDYDILAEKVAEKLSQKEQSYDVVLDEDGINSIAEKVAEKLGSSEEEEDSYDLIIDEEGINAIAKAVCDELRNTCGTCECAPAEETQEPEVEEEEETPVEEELSVASLEHYQDDGHGGLIDADTGLVVRLKRSFTAKMKQSDEKVKEYYSALKNALTSYKKVKSNVSWHADRFNCGRETVAKMNICGKTLCFYLALDPNDPEYKDTVYHQKDVSDKKAYENTPFMVKVKSDVGVKKAIRLIDSLAKKYGVEKRSNFEEVNYVDEFYYESTEDLLGDGFIKATKEKRVNLKF